MKTSKEMQLKILNKMRENISENERVMYGIEVYNPHREEWINSPDTLNFNVDKYRIKLQTITINGVEIPKPLELSKELDKEAIYYISCHSSDLYDTVCIRYLNIQKPKFSYLTKEEAIEASKLLFGIED